jgi:tRNA (cytidine32/uridine32-2'-O)-methyltransferase
MTRIVLVETTHPGNIGAAARAMKTMGLTQLALVNPRCEIDEEAHARASGAGDVLADASLHGSLDDAVGHCSLVVGASARLRSLPWPTAYPRDCVARIAELDPQAAVAAVFGPERSGLENRDLERCDLLMHIPTDPAFSSLNLAAAVQLFCYELRLIRVPPQQPSVSKDRLASAEERARLYAHLESVLVAVEFLDPGNPRQVMRRIKRLCSRSALEAIEVNILRGILTAVEQRLRRRS